MGHQHSGRPTHNHKAEDASSQQHTKPGKEQHDIESERRGTGSLKTAEGNRHHNCPGSRHDTGRCGSTNQHEQMPAVKAHRPVNQIARTEWGERKLSYSGIRHSFSSGRWAKTGNVITVVISACRFLLADWRCR